MLATCGGGGGGGGSSRPTQPATPAITTNSLPEGTTEEHYYVLLVGSGGTPPYSWNLAAGSNPLPTGLSINSAGEIFGTPKASGNFGITVRMQDSLAKSATK